MDKQLTGTGGKSPPTVATKDLDVTQVFDLLESNNADVVQEIRSLINENFNNTKESWLVGGLFEYYLHSGSMRCAEILCGISREPHDKFLIDKMTEGIRSTSKDTRRHTLIFLGQVVSKQPSWLYKITHHTLLREVIRLLKTETDVVVLMTGLLSVIMIIPTLPTYITPYINDIFDVFGRLATWTHTSHNIPREHLLHLQVGLYSLFHRLYAMYPCNFLSYLRHNFSTYEKRVVFLHTIMPMLEKVKMHPALVTATKEGEMNPQRWRSKEYHEVIAECSKISLDVYESSFPEEVTPTFSRLNSIDPGHRKGSTVSFADMTSDAIHKLPPSSLISQAMRTSDLVSLVTYIDDTANTAPPTPLSVTSIGGANSVLPPPPTLINKNVSPPTPETAMEATPENTPIKDRERLHFKLPPNSPAAVQLNFANIEQIKDKYARQPYLPPVVTTPGNSVPSSPLPLSSTSTVTEFPSSSHPLVRRDSIFDSSASGTTLRRDSLMFQRLQKVQLEQQQLAQTASDTSTGAQSAITSSSRSGIGSEPLPSLTQRKTSTPAPITIIQSNQFPDEPSSTTSDFLSDRDRPTGGPLTPLFCSSGQGQTVTDIDLSLLVLEEESTVDSCHPSACSQGGLHMADHKQMIAFAKRVSRLRFHSQCASGSNIPEVNTSGATSPGTSPSSTSSTGLLQFKGRIIKRSFSCPNIKQPIISEVEEYVTSSGTGECDENDVGEITPKAEDYQLSVTETTPTENDISQTAEAEQSEHPYEHLFQQILPTILSPPVDSRTLPSPHYLLDICIMKAANLHNARSKSDEISMLRGQVDLLHGQLLFERHRREAHALRNRRLALKCRKMQNMEEQTNSMRREIHILEKEVALLKQEVITQRGMGLTKEKELQAIIVDLDRKLENYRRQLSDLQDDKSQIDMKYSCLHDEYSTLQKESDQKKADLFSLENEIKHLQKYLEMNTELRMAYEVSQKEILLLGELLRRHQETMVPTDSHRFLKEEMEDMRHTCEEEIRSLRNALDSKMSQCEVACGMIQDLEKKLEKREAIIMEQKQILHDSAKDHMDQLQVLENKYEIIKAANQKLELEILNLQHQLTLKNYQSRSSRGRITSSPSNGEMSPTGNSNHSDVDSAASAAGYQLSPERNTCFFGSPQFDFPPDEMKDLQSVLDQGSTSTSTSAAGTRRNSTTQD